jgi:hypothetical protein
MQRAPTSRPALQTDRREGAVEFHLDALEARMLLRADSNGRVVLDLPNKGCGREGRTQ